AGAEVSHDDQTVKSDDSGIASFMNVPAGGHTLKSGDVSKIIYVEADDNYAKVQEFSLEIKAFGFNWVRAAIVVFSVTALAVIALFFSAKSKIDGSAASGGGISGGSSSGDAKPVTSSLSVAPEPKVISPGAQNTN